MDETDKNKLHERIEDLERENQMLREQAAFYGDFVNLDNFVSILDNALGLRKLHTTKDQIILAVRRLRKIERAARALNADFQTHVYVVGKDEYEALEASLAGLDKPAKD